MFYFVFGFGIKMRFLRGLFFCCIYGVVVFGLRFGFVCFVGVVCDGVCFGLLVV